MTIRKYLRTDSDCMLLYRNETDSRMGECQALIYTAFEQYVLKDKCGTDKCPFYKKIEKAVKAGNTEVK